MGYAVPSRTDFVNALTIGGRERKEKCVLEDVGNLPSTQPAFLGGLLYLSGALIMVYNFWKTIRGDVNEKESNLQVQGAAA